jgi:hypothetical protein
MHRNEKGFFFAADPHKTKGTECRMVQDELVERARQAVLGAEIGAALIQSKDLRGLLQLCAESIVKNLDAAFARIWTLNENDNVLGRQAQGCTPISTGRMAAYR